MKEIEKIHEDALAESKARSEKFFKYFGLNGLELAYAQTECEEFVRDFAEANLGAGFYHAPIARKAFMIGFFRGRNTLRGDSKG
jgi:hypothetical protein